MHLAPIKRLGQNFLVDKNVQQKIIQSCSLSLDDTVLEIGSGKGALTSAIARCVKKVYALEIDSSLCALLRDKLSANSNVEIIQQDILSFEIKKVLKLRNKKIKVIGNIPYYISSPILEHLFRFSKNIHSAYLTVQKEFSQRIVASPGSKIYGSLSCFVQYYSIPKVLFTIKKGSFYPIPKVDSSFLRLVFRLNPPVAIRNEELFFKIIRKAFSQRRKTLRNSLRGEIGPQALGGLSGLRPEQLSLEEFAFLSQKPLKLK